MEKYDEWSEHESLTGYLTGQITPAQEHALNGRLFDIAQSYFRNPSEFELDYEVTYDALQKQLGEKTGAFNRLFNFAESSIAVKDGPFRLLRSMEEIHHFAKNNDTKQVNAISYYTCIYFIMSRIAVKNKLPRKKVNKVFCFDLDLSICPFDKYFDIVFEIAPFLYRDTQFFKNYASDIYSILHYYCSEALLCARGE